MAARRCENVKRGTETYRCGTETWLTTGIGHGCCGGDNYGFTSGKTGASRVRHKLEAGKGLISQVGAVRGLAQGHQLFLEA